MMADVVLADFFSGCGGTTLGFADAGMAPALAIDWEPDAAATFKLNFPTTAVIEQDIRELGVDEVEAVLEPKGDSIKLFAGCAPCQPFAGHRHEPTHRDSRSFLLLEFLRFVKALNPELIFVENVPGIGNAAPVRFAGSSCRVRGRDLQDSPCRLRHGLERGLRGAAD